MYKSITFNVFVFSNGDLVILAFLVVTLYHSERLQPINKDSTVNKESTKNKDATKNTEDTIKNTEADELSLPSLPTGIGSTATAPPPLVPESTSLHTTIEQLRAYLIIVGGIGNEW